MYVATIIHRADTILFQRGVWINRTDLTDHANIVYYLDIQSICWI